MEAALRLAKYCGTSAEFWINLRSHYDLRGRVAAYCRWSYVPERGEVLF